MRLRALMLLIMAGILASGCTGAARQADLELLRMARAPQSEAEYIVAPPDELVIEVVGHPDYSRAMIVRPDGRITIPGVGDMYVQGMTTAAIRDAAVESLSALIPMPNVTVSLVAARSKAIYVLGEVRRPGTQPYYGDMNLIDALGAAGGLTLYANIDSVRLTREDLDNPQLLTLDLRRLIHAGAAEQNVVLQEGDIIFVPPTTFARVGYAFDQLLFPFRAALSGLITYGGVRTALD